MEDGLSELQEIGYTFVSTLLYLNVHEGFHSPFRSGKSPDVSFEKWRRAGETPGSATVGVFKVACTSPVGTIRGPAGDLLRCLRTGSG